jgi:CheY-like chemotaxis protein
MPKILLVEDNEENRDALSRRLVRRGFEVVFAGDGKAAVAQARAERPDIILMDINLPEMDGWEAMGQIKADPATRDLAIIALTAHALTADRERALQVGCADYHTKPVEFPRLLSQIETVLKSRTPAP